MILERDTHDSFAGRVTLDQIFRRAVQLRPEAPALGERAGGRLNWLSFAEAERAVAALAARLSVLGLAPDSVIALQGRASIAQVIALLAVGRAGFIPMMVPELWREADLAPAISSSGARALVSFGDGGALAALHCTVAAEVFRVRFVCALQDEGPDGVVPLGSLDALVAAAAGEAPAELSAGAADHVAVLTWDAGPRGPYLVPRSHRAVVAGGVPVLIAGRLDETAVLVSTLALSGFAGLASGLAVWLLSGGALVVAAPADTATLVGTVREAAGTHLAVPALVGGALSAEGLLGRCERLRTVFLLNRTPEQPGPPWATADIGVVDIAAWGEAALLASRRDGPAQKPVMPTRAEGDSILAATAVTGHRTPQGLLAVSGAMVPRVAFPALAGLALPLVAGGACDTGWTCHPDAAGTGLVCDAPPRDVARVGGYRLSLPDTAAKLAKAVGAPVELAAVPHRVLGQRIIATTAAPDAVAAAAPLVAGALAPPAEPVAPAGEAAPSSPEPLRRSA